MEGSASTTAMQNVVSAITGATSDLGTQAITLIGAAVGLGVIFWGAKLLWTKFKSMAK